MHICPSAASAGRRREQRLSLQRPQKCLSGPAAGSQLLYQALKAIDVAECTVSHTSAATNKWWAQIKLLYPPEQRGAIQSALSSPYQNGFSLFLSSQNCHHQIAEVIISDFRAITLMVTAVQQSQSCLDSTEMTVGSLLHLCLIDVCLTTDIGICYFFFLMNDFIDSFVLRRMKNCVKVFQKIFQHGAAFVKSSGRFSGWSTNQSN